MSSIPVHPSPDRPSARHAARRFLWFLMLLLAGCKSSPKPEWVEADVQPVSLGVLFEVTRLALVREGFPVPAQGFDPRTREVTSGWRMDLHPFRGEGFRERATIGYEPRSGGRLDLSVRVERQVNQNIARPLEAAHADWKQAPDEPGRARVLLQSIRSLLGDPRQVERPRVGA